MAFIKSTYVSGFLLWVLMSLNPLYGIPQHRHPFGPLMCIQLCGEIVGCSAYWYRPSHLSCTIGNTTDITQQRMKLNFLYHMTKDANLSSQLNDPKCAIGSRVIPSRTGISCVKYIDNPRTGNPPVNSRLLMVPSRNIKMSQFYQVDLKSGTTDLFTHINTTRIIFILYLHSTNKLILSTYVPRRIISTPINEYSPGILHASAAKCMTSDEGANLLFTFDTTSGKCHLRKMNINGENPKSVSRKSFIFSLVADIKRKMIYGAASKGLLAFSYDLENFQVLDTGKKIKALTIDLVGDNIFYNKAKDINIRSLIKNTSEKVITTGRYARWFLYYNKSVYMSNYGIWNKKFILAVWQNSTGIRDAAVNVQGSTNYLICLIP